MKKQIGLMTMSMMLASTAFAGGAGAPAPKPTAGKCMTISQLVASNAQLSTLNTALDAAGLKSTLSAAGSYTVFAPTDAAFAKVPSDQLASVLNDADALRSLLLYHVVAEKATAAQIRGVKGGTTVQGADIAVTTQGNTLKINNATVTRADINACNGIVHLIDTVLMPPMAVAAPVAEPAAAAPAPAPAAAPAPVPVAAAPIVIPATPLSGSTITNTAVTAPATTETATTTEATTEATTETTEATTETTEATTEVAPAAVDITVETNANSSGYQLIQTDARFSTLKELIVAADLGSTLEGLSGAYTIFAPTNDAFATLPEEILVNLKAAANKEALQKVLLYHLVKSKVNVADLGNPELMTAQGTALDLGAAALTTQLVTGGSVVYPIDVVLLPTDFVIPDAPKN